MIYRGPGFLEVVWFGSSPTHNNISVSILEKSENIVQKSLEEIEIIYLLKNTKDF